MNHPNPLVSSPSRVLAGPDWADGDGAAGSIAHWQAATRVQEPLAAAAAQSGAFAVALDLGGGRAFLAVDRMARRTLCWRVAGGRLHASPQADALREADGQRAEIDPQAILDYLYFHAIPSPRTVFAGVFRLPPGHCALFADGRVTVQPFWRARFAPNPSLSFEPAKAEFRRLLESAVARQLDGSTPACFLSGGTDSSTVAGLIGKVAGTPAQSYSIGFDAQGYDEMAYARIAARRFGTRHTEYYVTPADLVQHIPRVAAGWDQPFGNSSALPSFCCALRAREQGVTRLLAGDGGDELFGGNSRYTMLGVFGLWGKVPAMLRKGLLEPFFGLDAVARTPLLKKGSGYIRQANTPMPDRLQNHNLLMRLGPDRILGEGLLAQVDLGAPLAAQREVWAEAEAACELDRNLAFDWRFTLAESDLPKVRGATAQAGVEVGYPLLDDALTDFSTTLPQDYKLRGRKLRWFFKEALRGFLPEEIIAKPKHGFGLPFGVWALQHPELATMARESAMAVAERGVVNKAFADRLFGSLLAEHPGYYGELVWVLMLLEQWLRRHAPDWRCT
jgi:asparagine synthase (glutamine-hydrolysing)